VDPFEEDQVLERGVGLVQLAELSEDQGIALAATLHAQPARHRLLRQFFDLPADPVVDVLKQADLEIMPGVTCQEGREIRLVELGCRLCSL
jgi:hypothetical protein